MVSKCPLLRGSNESIYSRDPNWKLHRLWHKRIYRDDCIQFGFVWICIGIVKLLQSVICQKVLGSDSMRPNKLKAHFENIQPAYQGEDNSFFDGLERSIKEAKLDKARVFQQ